MRRARIAGRGQRTWLAAMLTAIAATDASGQPAEGFFDDFDGFNRDRWKISDGWANGSWQNCVWSAKQVSVSDSIAKLSLVRLEDPETQPQAEANADAAPTEGSEAEDAKKKPARAFACGEFHTKARYGHGTFEARLRSDTGSGMNAAFFTYIGPIQDEPHDEIDVEVLTRDTSRVSLNTYVEGEPHNGKVVPVPGGTDAQFNDYAFVWEPDRIRWYLNGELVHEASGTLPSRPQRIFFSLWGTDTLTKWMGTFEYPDRPVEMLVDWVAYTPPGESCLFPESLTCAGH